MEYALPSPEVLPQAQPVKSRRILHVALIISAVLATAGGGVVLGKYLFAPKVSNVCCTRSATMPTPTPTTTPVPTYRIYNSESIVGWKTYEEKQRRLIFSYPDKMLVITTPTQTEPVYSPGLIQLYDYNLATDDRTHFDPELDKDKIKMEISTSRDTNASLEEFIKEANEQEEELHGKVEEKNYENVLIGGQKATKYISTRGGLHTQVVYVMNPKTSMVHTITAMPRYDLHKELVDRIISTIRFID